MFLFTPLDVLKTLHASYTLQHLLLRSIARTEDMPYKCICH